MELRSCISSAGQLRLNLEELETPLPGPGEVLVRVEAAPINPSDLILLLGPADLGTLQVAGTPDRPLLTATAPPKALRALEARLDQAMPWATKAPPS